MSLKINLFIKKINIYSCTYLITDVQNINSTTNFNLPNHFRDSSSKNSYFSQLKCESKNIIYDLRNIITEYNLIKVNIIPLTEHSPI